MKNEPQTTKTILELISKGLPAEAVTLLSADTNADQLNSPKFAQRDRIGYGEGFIEKV